MRRGETVRSGRLIASGAARSVMVCCLAWGLPVRAAAQGSEPLHKSDLIRLLAQPLIHQQEVAALVRRNCLAFRPTQRDWTDLRGVGADADVLNSVGECAARSAPARAVPRPQPSLPSLSAVALSPHVATPVGTEAVAEVEVRRSGVAQAGIALVLRGSAAIPGGAGREVEAVTGDSGVAAFLVPAGTAAGTYRLEVVTAAGAPLPGNPAVRISVRPGPPAVAHVRPARVEVGPAARGPTPVFVAVRDSFGNRVPGERVTLQPASPKLGILPDSGSTDSLGVATFMVERAAIRRSGTLEVRVRGERLAALEAVVVREQADSTGTTFVPGDSLRGVVRHHLPQALAFQVRGAWGEPLAGRVVVFRARNATIAPDSAVTDSAGRIQLDVTLGARAGTAGVSARVDSVEKQLTVLVSPGPPVGLILERDSVRVDGGYLRVGRGIPFDLMLKAHDGYGNVVSSPGLARQLEEVRARFNAAQKLLRLVRVRADASGAVLTFKPTAVGSTDLTLAVSGISKSVSVDIVP
jgi:hypothetical protein